ncbi:FMN-dependent NADH-azoreductase [Glacieibacterium frigidum]|uniref:FMN dependent NADH:quinone oxidoreductase n=1 Tax=Glacieibacterium frigidum TaxID=2593303 RepID=A0A552U9L1_9SPHN|nr:FMN-dependent NADH-azoreductase [Glacieibacterium frigidum]TRW14906.1 FMN-dependent NADH-azoreductase [Glacieibacterium frigidum]
MKLLHLDSSILGGNSVSRTLSADVVARLVAAAPGTTVTYRDLAADPVAHLSGAYLAAAQAGPSGHDAAITADLATGQAVLAEFLAADTVVIGVPLYNFGVPSQLKAWIDRILIAGQTFRYGPDGRPEGLAGGKRVVLALARGGFYGPGQPSEAFEHGESYLRAALGFIGITDIEVIAADGLAVGPEQKAAALADAGQRIAALAA